MQVNATKSAATDFDNPSGNNVRLLVQAMVVVERVDLNLVVWKFH